MICGHFVCDTSYRVERDDFSSYLLFYVEKGKLSISTRGKKVIAAEGDLALISCHEPHKYQAVTPVEFSYIHFDGAQCTQLYETFFNEIGVVVSGTKNQTAENCIKTCLSAYRTDQPLPEVTISKLLYTCLCSLLETSQQVGLSGIQNPQIAEAVEYIKINYAKTLSLKQIAAIVNLSPYYFSRQFKRQTGYSPYEFIIICRINAAKHLLKTTDTAIKQIAYTVGYGSEIAFTNSFTQKVGISPIRFRKFEF